MDPQLRAYENRDREWAGSLLAGRWGSTRVVTRGTLHRADRLAGFVAELEGRPQGLVTYRIEGKECEVVTLDALAQGRGVGTALLGAVLSRARARGCRRAVLVTTNDNLPARRFYEGRGFRVAAVREGAVTRARAMKPEIPAVGVGGVPIRDEIELEMEIPAMEFSDEALDRYAVDRFPRSARYDPAWVHRNEMGPNVLWMTEALAEVMDVGPSMRVLDLGCGTALSSIFLAREFGAQVWAFDLWIDATENLRRVREAGLEDRVFPLRGEARSLPFASGFFDAVVSLDSYHYFGTDVHYLEFHLLELLRPGGRIGIVSPASPERIPDPPPPHLGQAWFWMNTVAWWRDLWARTPGLELERAELLPGGFDLWVRWHEFLEASGCRNRPTEVEELRTLRADGGRHLGFVRMVGRRYAGPDDPSA